MGDNDDVNFDCGFGNGMIVVVVAMLVVLVMLVIMITVVWMEFEKNSLIFIFTMTQINDKGVPTIVLQNVSIPLELYISCLRILFFFE